MYNNKVIFVNSKHETCFFLTKNDLSKCGCHGKIKFSDITIELMFAGVNMFLARLRLILK